MWVLTHCIIHISIIWPLSLAGLDRFMTRRPLHSDIQPPTAPPFPEPSSGVPQPLLANLQSVVTPTPEITTQATVHSSHVADLLKASKKPQTEGTTERDKVGGSKPLNKFTSENQVRRTIDAAPVPSTDARETPLSKLLAKLKNRKHVAAPETNPLQTVILTTTSAPVIIEAQLPKLPANARPVCELPTSNRTGSKGAMSTVTPRPKPRSVIALVPGKGVHCSLAKQITSGLDCPCQRVGKPCAVSESICVNVTETASACACNLATSTRKGNRCELTNIVVPARGTGFKIFSPAPVLEISCKIKLCEKTGFNINTLMGNPPFKWNIEKSFASSTSSNSKSEQRGITIEIDPQDASIYLTNDQTKNCPDSGRISPVRSISIPAVTVYNVHAVDDDRITSNTISITLFLNNDCSNTV